MSDSIALVPRRRGGRAEGAVVREHHLIPADRERHIQRHSLPVRGFVRRADFAVPERFPRFEPLALPIRRVHCREIALRALTAAAERVSSNRPVALLPINYSIFLCKLPKPSPKRLHYSI